MVSVAGVYRLMAHDLRHGTRTAPSFDDAVALHKTLSAIEESAETGKRVRIVDRLVDFMRAFSGLIQASQD